MVATASIKTDELLASWLGSDTIYENVMRIIETQKASNKDCTTPTNLLDDGRPPLSPKVKSSKQHVEIPPFYAKRSDGNPQMPPPPKRRYSSSFTDNQSWHGDYLNSNEDDSPKSHEGDSSVTADSA
jgi:hypothetical protein